MMAGNSFISNFNMKDFIKYIAIVILAAFCTYYALVICAIFLKKSLDLRAPAEVTTAVFVNSTGECAIDDSILDDYKNYCASGLNYYMAEEYIKEALKQSPQIKTAVLCFDCFQYMSYSNRGIGNYKPSEYSFYSGFIAFDELKILHKYSLSEVIKLTISSNLLISPLKAQFGYNRLVRYKLRESIEKWNQLYPEIKDIPYEETKVESSYNISALLRIIHFCRQKGVNVVILSTPMYHLERWYGRTGYYDFLNTLDESVQIADYSDFSMPSDDCYGDVIHLNYKGAEYFSKHLKGHGLQAIPVKEYLKNKK